MDIIKDLIKEGRLQEKPQKVLKGFDENETLSPEYEIIHPPKPCPDCDLTVSNHRTLFYKRLSPVIHWAKKCNNCDRFQHPVTGKYSLSSPELGAWWRSNTPVKPKK
jgi:hypothetical protein|tara:strand:- start:1172 stop:1492 length:321 start_codon:yes stop_codon:yes gene_type:complete